MNTLILFYSLSGKTKKICEKLANENNFDIEEITEIKKRGTFKAFLPGIGQAIKGSKSKINPVQSSMSDYDEIILAYPVWASNPAPAAYSAVDYIPDGAKVHIKAISKSGASDSVKIEGRLKDKGCEILTVENIKSE